ncbi:MAG TPA: 4-hydroxythreonine-4-phosphate dehydrogenase PdxA [Stellaceae bacterium]|nr:4-hydroxythreonine-4-phosphate dehydrogenase PdxA [Stellaceae bacterium]
MTAPIALTMGEPAGIGGEITLKAWLRRHDGVPPFFAIDDPDRLARLAATLGWDVPLRAVAGPEEAAHCFGEALGVLPRRIAHPVLMGRPDPANARAVTGAIVAAVDLVRTGRAAAVVTNPIQKETLYAAGFRHPGHTEFLEELAGNDVKAIMMLACSELRVVPVTVHLALRDALQRLTREAIITAGRITARSLISDFGIPRPRLAVAGLNPHAGENGAMGREEIEIVGPAIEALRAEGYAVGGPYPADTMFHAAARARYDAALCMYHDQALIPIKTIDFDRGVNVTLGLPFIRTSPDHGTACDIAGKGIANPDSLIAALRLAGEMASRRTARRSVA